MYQAETKITRFKEKVSNSEIRVSVYIYPVIITRQIVERKPKRNVNQNVTNPAVVSKEMPIVTVVVMMIVNKNNRRIDKLPYYVSVAVMMVIVPAVLERIWIVAPVIIPPTGYIPTVVFPSPVPMIVFVVIVIPVKIAVVAVVIHVRRTIIPRPIIIAPTIFPGWRISFIAFINTGVRSPVFIFIWMRSTI